MSTTDTPNTPDFSSMPTGAPPEAPARAELDQRAVSQAKREIQGLVQEITQLSRSEVDPAEFYEELTKRIVSALAATGGAVWIRDAGDRLSPIYQMKIPDEILVEGDAAEQHHRLLIRTLQDGSGAMVPSRSVASDSEAGNPTDHLLILGVIHDDAMPRGILEVFQRADTSLVAQRGYQRFVRQMCELASDFLKAQRLRQFVDKQSLWEQLESFARKVHSGLDVPNIAYTIANEGRRLIAVDRVTIAVRHGKHFKIEAISGQESFDARSNLVVRLTELSEAATATGDQVWYTGDTSKLAPQVEQSLQRYLDLSHSRMVAVLPLTRQEKVDKKSRQEVIGALVVEQIDDSQARSGVRERAEVVCQHSSTSLANALEHQSLFLLPVWKALGQLRWITSARTLPKTIVVTVAAFFVVAVLLFVPADFELEAEGILQPTIRRDVFAPLDGVVIEVPARHAKAVQKGDLLARLRNTELEIQIADLVGRRDATAKQMRSLERAMLGENRLATDEQNQLAGQLLQTRKTYESLNRQMVLLEKKQVLLEITSPINAEVITWQVHERIERRPVRQGQVLMRLADPNGPWELWIDMPEDRMGHIAKAAQKSGDPLQVSYILATDPGRSLKGQVQEIHSSAEVRDEGLNSVRLRVAIDRSDLDNPRPGATVTAKVACGSRSIGYVWLHDLIQFIQAKILFRL